jgi:hypothetical protein
LAFVRSNSKGGHTLIDIIRSGCFLIQDGTPLPNSVQLKSVPYSNGWATIKNVRSTFERELKEAGWTFFFMAGEIKAIAFGFDRTKMIRAALKRLITNVRRQKCNCLEVDNVATRSFLGLPYVSVSAHSRHIQESSNWWTAEKTH